MKITYKTIFILLIYSLLASCSDTDGFLGIKSSFDSPFPKRNKNLTYALGDEFSIKRGKDTIDFKVTFRKSDRQNFIIEQPNQDTIFAGTVCKYRGLYYLNTQLNDTTYWIYAIEITDQVIIGLQTGWFQMLGWDDEFEFWLSPPGQEELNQRPTIIKYANPEKQIIRLTPDKKEMKKFYSTLIDSLPADTLVNWTVPITNVEIEKEIADIQETSTDQFEIISKLYPNPANDYCNVELYETEKYQFGIFDINGRLVNSGELMGKLNKIDLSDLSSGSYFMRVYPADSEDTETIKLIIKNQ